MALNVGFIANQRQPQIDIPDPVADQAKGYQLRELAMKDRMTQQAMADDQAQRQAFTQAGGDRAKYLQALATGGNYKAYQAAEKAGLDTRKAEADIGHVNAQTNKQQTDAQLAMLERGSSILATAKDQRSYDAARQALAQTIGPQAAEKLNPIFDPMLVQGYVAAGLKRADQLKNETQLLAQKETARHNTATEGLTARGQNMVNQRSVDANENGKWQYDASRGVTVNAKTGEARPVMQGGQPIAAKDAAKESAKVTDAKDVLALLDQASPLIDKATNSYAGVALDEAARTVGMSPKGAQAAAQLRALEGALISKMPKMSGPQSDKDVLLYKQMAGQIGDPSIPAAQKKAAMSTIREINERHAGSAGGATGAWDGGQNPAKTKAGASVSNW